MIGKQWRPPLWKVSRRDSLWLFLPLLITGIIIGISGYFGRQVEYQPVIPEAGVQFGDVIVDPAAGEIRFEGKVRQNEGWVRFLVYLCSYQWLEEEAAIISPVHLTDLQMAIALLD